MPASAFGRLSLRDVEGAAEFGAEWFEPCRHLAACGAHRVWLMRLLLGEGAALGDGGDVGTVVGENPLEGVSCFGDIVAVGDNAEQVVDSPAGRCDVQATAGCGRGHEGEAVINGVGLVAVRGRRVSEAHMLVDVVGWQLDTAVRVSRVTVNEPSVPIATTVQVSRLRTGSPAVVSTVRSFRRVTTTSPM